ncbi:MAG: exodeoxyribonuclease VII large subunit [Anaerolineales bacterium]|nr:exodeoxyribonuclease VII large subunit [Anaerolineales bacterium]
MDQLPLFEPPAWSVSELTRYLKDLLEEDHLLRDLWVIGEVSNISHPSSGHLYFTIKDSRASLKCVMWRNNVAARKWLPKEGDSLEVHGYIGIYEMGGAYQLYADSLRPIGEGALYQEFLRLKARLEAEGLFAPERKRPIPELPQKIGIVTSPSGAALRDILNTIRRRFPLVEVVIAPTPVQGVEAPAGIISALEKIEHLAKPDVIILSRGGGSIEDLWAFNDEGVARAIVATTVPVITGVGHETDFTIADFAADLRAPTPTAAAELATPNKTDILTYLAALQNNMEREISFQIANLLSAFQNVSHRLALHSPQGQIRRDWQYLDDLIHRLNISINHALQMRNIQVSAVQQRLSSLNPQAVLDRGFAIVSQADGQVVLSARQVSKNEILDVRVSDGAFGVKVTQKKQE